MNNFGELDQKKNNNLRQIEINEYYSLKNNAIIDIFKTIIIGLIPLILVIGLSKFDILPSSLVSAFSIIITFALILIVVIKIFNINSRDPRNFNNFKIPFDETAEELEDAGKLTSISNLLDKEFKGAFGCFDDSCCGKYMKFDHTKKKCVLNTDKFEIVKKSHHHKKLDGKNESDKNFVDSVNNINNSNIDSDSLIKFDKINKNLRNINLSNIHEEM